jgi:hypothetical protein
VFKPKNAQGSGWRFFCSRTVPIPLAVIKLSLIFKKTDSIAYAILWTSAVNGNKDTTGVALVAKDTTCASTELLFYGVYFLSRKDGYRTIPTTRHSVADDDVTFNSIRSSSDSGRLPNGSTPPFSDSLVRNNRR